MDASRPRRAPQRASPKAWCASPWGSRRLSTSRRTWNGGWRSIWPVLPPDKALAEQALAPSRRWIVLAQAACLAAAYFAAAKLALLLAIPPGYATALWPGSGIALAALLLAGNRLWPGVWVGSF